MGIDKSLATRSTSMLLLKLLQDEDMYGYQMIAELERRSNRTFSLKAGTLYPLLHDLQRQGRIQVYERIAETGRLRKYYSLTTEGRQTLAAKEAEWSDFSTAVNSVLAGGGASLATV